MRLPWIAVTVLLMWVSSFGIAFGVTEWRSGSNDHGLEAMTQCFQDLDEEFDRIFNQRPPRAPEAPPSGASGVALEVYQSQFDSYEREYEKYQDELYNARLDYRDGSDECRELVLD